MGKNSHGKQLFLIKLLSISFLFTLTNCSNSIRLIHSTYDISKNNLINMHDLKINKIVDYRNERKTIIGSHDINEVQFLTDLEFEEPLSEYLTNYINEFTTNDNTNTPNEVVLQIYLFKLSTYAIKQKPDSLVYWVRIYSDLNSPNPVSIRLEDTLFFSGQNKTFPFEKKVELGIRTLLEKLSDLYQKDTTNSNLGNDVKISRTNIIPPDEDHAILSNVEFIKDTLNIEEEINKSFGIDYLKGKNIKYGIRFVYRSVKGIKSEHFMTGTSIIFEYDQIENEAKWAKGYFLAVGYPFDFLYRFNVNRVNIYAGGSASAIIGTEKISNDESYFIFGGRFYQFIGINLGNIIQLETGVYEHLLANSFLNPNDLGLVFSFYFGL